MSDQRHHEASFVDVWRYADAVRLISIELFGKTPSHKDVFARLTPAAFNLVYLHEEQIYVAGRLFAGVSSKEIDSDQVLIEKYRALKSSQSWRDIAQASDEDVQRRVTASEFA